MGAIRMTRLPPVAVPCLVSERGDDISGLDCGRLGYEQAYDRKRSEKLRRSKVATACRNSCDRSDK